MAVLPFLPRACYIMGADRVKTSLNCVVNAFHYLLDPPARNRRYAGF